MLKVLLKTSKWKLNKFMLPCMTRAQKMADSEAKHSLLSTVRVVQSILPAASPWAGSRELFTSSSLKY
jgi:hypothetical protein